jgi:NADH:ubiquinone oxidoreductase subunit F (NADH-binding)
MAKEKVIAFNNQLFDVNKSKNVTHNIVSIFIDSFSGYATIRVEHFEKVESIKISIEEAVNIGFLNFDALNKYCN